MRHLNRFEKNMKLITTVCHSLLIHYTIISLMLCNHTNNHKEVKREEKINKFHIVFIKSISFLFVFISFIVRAYQLYS